MRESVLIFCHHYATQFIDVCNQYASLFDPGKYHVTVAWLRGVPDAHVRERTEADEVIFLDAPRDAVRGLKMGVFLRLLRLCRQRQFSIVVCHRYKPIYLMMGIAQFVRIRSLFYVMHDLGTFRSMARRMMVRLLARKNMTFAGVSNAVRDDMRRSLKGWIAPSRIVTLYNCIDMPALLCALRPREESLRALRLPAGRFVFGTFGRLETVKDQATMLRAFALIRETCPDAILVISGIGTEEARLRALADTLGITDRVYFTGFVMEVWQYLLAFDVFMLTSTREAFGRVLPEAMTARVPVIGVTTDGIPEVIGKAGKVLPPRDPEALAEAMRAFWQMSPEERANWGRLGYEQIETHFSVPRFREVFWSLACPA